MLLKYMQILAASGTFLYISFFFSMGRRLYLLFCFFAWADWLLIQSTQIHFWPPSICARCFAIFITTPREPLTFHSHSAIISIPEYVWCLWLSLMLMLTWFCRGSVSQLRFWFELSQARKARVNRWVYIHWSDLILIVALIEATVWDVKHYSTKPGSLQWSLVCRSRVWCGNLAYLSKVGIGKTFEDLSRAAQPYQYLILM